MPALATSLRIGVGATVQLAPSFAEWRIRPAPTPPVANQISCLPVSARQELLAAKAPSFGNAGTVRRRVQLIPPSLVVKIVGSALTGSPAITPWSASRNATESKKPVGSGLVNRSFHIVPASVVL